MCWSDMETTYGMFSSQMSGIFWEVVESLTETYGYFLELRELSRDKAVLYVEKISERRAPFPNCVGFVDCSHIPICRPGGLGSLQRACFSGHTLYHCLKYMTMTTPDGLMLALFWMEVGRRHDITLLQESRWGNILQKNLNIENLQ